MLTENIIRNTIKRHVRYQTDAFTLIESLVTLGITLFVVTLFSAGVAQVYHAFERNLFYIRFEQFYTESQTMAWARQEEMTLSFKAKEVRGPDGCLSLPDGIYLKSVFDLSLNQKGNHTGLSRIVFAELDQKREVHYQARIGNGILLQTEEEH